MVVVVLPTPPFWLHIEITRALPWMLIGRGSGSTGIGRPVGPSGTSEAPARRSSVERLVEDRVGGVQLVGLVAVGGGHRTSERDRVAHAVGSSCGRGGVGVAGDLRTTGRHQGWHLRGTAARCSRAAERVPGAEVVHAGASRLASLREKSTHRFVARNAATLRVTSRDLQPDRSTTVRSQYIWG